MAAILGLLMLTLVSTALVNGAPAKGQKPEPVLVEELNAPLGAGKWCPYSSLPVGSCGFVKRNAGYLVRGVIIGQSHGSSNQGEPHMLASGCPPGSYCHKDVCCRFV